ncbi:phenylalanine--tRNA ligase subunit beta [Candidatus Woesebacteria bacterium RIFCSPLOWO2_01_FULL_43_11]|uniref:Phenylalanine--tRNA ligase beta subunit n=1 Tax=Candidatus Woesebacteria bacterium RBG_16_42_24 TaxID=1802485 RepID=A0A1F7XKU0_9BACT|nr:MAG: phenylalanine--tRNA ligase subunit beta [Candidatus Woesebacteria bacterium RBG_16_42_24]OGM67398.1 MAG: phenylalanine--tRNA ligase subunit beta [Candidatus Woesebacteria bacterium RIFCSPLOWO2_01_FULL_43_11]
MNILVPDNWLRDFLQTKASTNKIAEDLSLCGPSVEKVERVGSDSIYSIEVTTNRVDSASVFGIAREACAILPQFGVKALLYPIKVGNLKFVSKVNYLEVNVDSSLCPRFSAVLIRNVSIAQSPDWMKERLSLCGVRPINNVVDISNYIMHELGQPVHTFDYDKILGAKMVLRKSRRVEKLTTLDGKTHALFGDDIVIEDGKGRLIDLAGIMGGENSAVDETTKNILLFVQTYNPVNIRKTSMSLAHRTEAAVLFEKSLDPELVSLGISRGIDLFESLTKGKAEKEILDIYPNPYKPMKVQTNLDFINSRLGISLSKSNITQIFGSLGFEANWRGGTLEVLVPSWRANDVSLPEDIVEEIARIYGYHKLPSKLMEGAIPEPLVNSPFEFESKIKSILKGYGAAEVYTLSLVSSGEAPSGLKLKNPLGPEGEYLRTSLMPSLVKAAKENSGEKEPYHLFEMANIYLPAGRQDLPEEKMTLAGIFVGSSFREAKGMIEGLLAELKFEGKLTPEEGPHYLPSRRLSVKSGPREIGSFGELEEGSFYYEIDVEELRADSKEVGSFTAIPKYPAQIEDITLSFPGRTKIGEVISSIKSSDKLIARVELTDTFQDSYTFRLWYQHPSKTLTDGEVDEIRKLVIRRLNEKFGGVIKG